MAESTISGSRLVQTIRMSADAESGTRWRTTCGVAPFQESDPARAEARRAPRGVESRAGGVATQTPMGAARGGQRTTVDVLNSRTGLFLAQRNYTQARYNYILATLRLKSATGSLSAEDLKQINGWLKK